MKTLMQEELFNAILIPPSSSHFYHNCFSLTKKYCLNILYKKLIIQKFDYDPTKYIFIENQRNKLI